MKLDTVNLPKHVAFIMDGNRRWARERGLSQLEGHIRGVDATEPIIDHAISLGIPYLTFWAFSTENWRRSKREVEFLLRIFRERLDRKVDDFHRKNVKLNIIGNLAMFPQDLQEKSQRWMEKTKDNTTITVNVALSYGGRDEIIRASQKLSNQLITQSSNNERLKEQFNHVTMEQFSNFLDTAGQPDPDLLIRTGGQRRLSGFLLWQLEYAELYFTDTLWPAFTPQEFDTALAWYQQEKRNFGK